ncbi:MAG: DUF2924 domain-containing protein [Burkholderiaceae bacterium]|nr:MAG: DUF2924 domain-containing protein [Burkholderiaceae bacterium]
MSSVSESLAELATLERSALAARWTAAFACPPPRSSQVALLRRVLAWQLQMQASSTWRAPSAPARLARSLRPAPSAPTLTPGTRLLRQWQDRTHVVTVLAQGFEYEDKVHRSLSAIARQITGTPWSGPAFFGLRS